MIICLIVELFHVKLMVILMVHCNLGHFSYLHFNSFPDPLIVIVRYKECVVTDNGGSLRVCTVYINCVTGHYAGYVVANHYIQFDQLN